MTSYDLTTAAAREHVSVLRDQARDDRLAARAACLNGTRTMGDRLRSAMHLARRGC